MRAQDETLRRMYSATGVLEIAGGDAVISHRPIGVLRLRRGSLMTADAFAPLDRKTIEEPIAPGDYPAALIIATVAGCSRVAGMMLRIRESAPVRWESSPTGAFDPTSVGILATPSFTIESGFACWGDEFAAAAWLDAMEHHSGSARRENLRNTMVRATDGIWSYGEIPGENQETGNVLIATAGMGRGMFWSFSGYDAGGALACVITDFRLEDHVEVAPRARAEVRPRAWWKFWQ